MKKIILAFAIIFTVTIGVYLSQNGNMDLLKPDDFLIKHSRKEINQAFFDWYSGDANKIVKAEATMRLAIKYFNSLSDFQRYIVALNYCDLLEGTVPIRKASFTDCLKLIKTINEPNLNGAIALIKSYIYYNDSPKNKEGIKKEIAFALAQKNINFGSTLFFRKLGQYFAEAQLIKIKNYVLLTSQIIKSPIIDLGKIKFFFKDLIKDKLLSNDDLYLMAEKIEEGAEADPLGQIDFYVKIVALSMQFDSLENCPPKDKCQSKVAQTSIKSNLTKAHMKSANASKENIAVMSLINEALEGKNIMSPEADQLFQDWYKTPKNKEKFDIAIINHRIWKALQEYLKIKEKK